MSAKPKLQPALPALAAANDYHSPREFAWLQDAAFDVLLNQRTRRNRLARDWGLYYALVMFANDTESEPGPDRDGRAFQSSVLSLALRARLKPADVRARLLRFVRLGLLDTFTPSKGRFDRLTLRLRTVRTQSKGQP